jgi:tetratricopeptide (TPR) repeat protein
MGEKGNVAESQMALANLLFEEGDAIGAESSLREAREEFRKEGIGDDEILANTLLARILLSQGRLADAQKEVSGLQDLLAKSQDFSVRLRSSIAEGQIAAAEGRPQQAVGILQTTIASARKSGYLGYEFEAQLALGEVETKSGRAGAGMSLLTEVRTQAQQRGFQLIAYKATRLSWKSGTVPTK